MRNLSLLSILALGLTLALSGCGGNTYSVTLQVLLEGKPLPDARVEFNPTDSKQRPAFGMSDANGYVTLNTSGENDGALPGEYKVTVVADKQTPAPGSNPNFPADTKWITTSLVHENYRTVDKTPLKATVPGVAKLELKADGT